MGGGGVVDAVRPSVKIPRALESSAHLKLTSLLVWSQLLARYCFVVWILFSVCSTFCITSFSDRTHQHQETNDLSVKAGLAREKRRKHITLIS